MANCPELVSNIKWLLDIKGMIADYYFNSKYYCIEYSIPMENAIFDMGYPTETVCDKTKEFISQAILRLYDEWTGSIFVCDKNLILRLEDDVFINPDWFVKAEQL